MNCKLVLLFVAIISVANGRSVVVGQVDDRINNGVRKVFEQQYETSAVPLFKRTQEVRFEYPVGDQKIKGIAIRDMENGLAEASIIRGGLEMNYVHIKLKSARGAGFKYQIEVYA